MREEPNLSGEEFGEHLGMTKAAVSSWETGKSAVTKALALAIEHVFGVSSQWVIEGSGDWWNRSGSIRPQQALLRPLLEGAPECGPGGQILDPGLGATLLAFPHDHAQDLLYSSGGGSIDDLFFVRVSGESMMPTLIDNDLILVNTAIGVRIQPREGAIFLVRRSQEDDEIRVKRLYLDKNNKKMLLISDNKLHHQTMIEIDGIPIHQLILGRVVWVGRNLLEGDSLTEVW